MKNCFTKKNVMIGIAVFAVLALAIYFLFIRKKVDTTNLKDIATRKTEPEDDKALFPLKFSSMGNPVKQLQIYLNKKYGAQFPNFGIDGKLGSETLANMRKYLKRDSISEAFYQKAGIGSI